MMQAEEKSSNHSNRMQQLDENHPDFYENVQNEIESDLARMKKTVEVILNLRLTAAEVEVETAALYHAELWFDLLNTQMDAEHKSDGEDDDKKNDNV